MPGGLFPRLTIWVANQKLTAAAIDAEFDNIINNLLPAMIDDYSVNVAQMQIVTSPGNVGTESLATSLAGELERLRFMIEAITGEPIWYQSPVTNLLQLNTALGAAALANKISSGQTNGTPGSTQPTFLVPAGSANTVTLNAVTVPFVYSIQGASYTISTNVAVTSLTTAPTAQNTAVVNDASMSGQTWTKIAGEHGSVITLAAVGNNITALSGSIAAFKNQTTGELFIGRVISPIINAVTTYQITEAKRGYFYNSSSVPVGRGVIQNGDVIQLLKLTWVFATATGGLAIFYNNPVWSGTAPSSPNIGDYWFDMLVNYWKIYNGTSFASADATLIGLCVQDTTHSIGTRSFDFYEGFSTSNNCELILDQTSADTVRTRYIGCQVSVYGSILNIGQGYLYWTAGSANVSGVTVSAGNTYYLYLDEIGNTYIDSVAPYDRRADLLGYYHPNQTWRCLGYAYATGTNVFSVVETFYRNAPDRAIETLTGTNATEPLPDLIRPSEWLFTIDTSGGSFTQVLPPVAQSKGQRITYTKITTDFNQCTLQVFEPIILTTTADWTVGTSVAVNLGATTGVTAGQLVSGTSIPRGTIVTARTGTTASLSNTVFNTKTTTGITFGTAGGINNNVTFNLCTMGESVTFLSTGTMWVIDRHTIPSDPQPWTPTLSAGFGTAGSVRMTYRRVNNRLVGTGSFIVGTTSATPGSLTIPSGLSIDSDNLNIAHNSNWAGLALRMSTGTDAIQTAQTVTLFSEAATADTLFFQQGTYASQTDFNKENVSSMYSSGDSVVVDFSVPILGWMG